MTEGRWDIPLRRGETFSRSMTWRDTEGVPVPLGGYSARLQVRRTVDSADVLFELTDLDGLTLGGDDGTIDVYLSATTTAALTFSAGVYDLELEAADGTVKRLLEGRVSVSPEVTR